MGVECLEDWREGIGLGPAILFPLDDLGDGSEVSVTSELNSSTPSSSPRPTFCTEGLHSIADPSDNSLRAGLAGEARLLMLLL